MKDLLGVDPADILVHGPKKILIDKIHWHLPDTGVVVSYTPKARDVEDHFGIFRGVDQIESFAQAINGCCLAFLECMKQKCDLAYLKANFTPIFLGIGQVNFKNVLREGETYISIGKITFYKFRNITCEGRIYKVPKDLDLDAYFSKYTKEGLLDYELNDDFTLIAELSEVTGKLIKNEK